MNLFNIGSGKLGVYDNFSSVKLSKPESDLMG